MPNERRMFILKALVLWAAALVGVVLVMPYTMALAPGRLEAAAADLGIPIAAVIALSLLQSAILLGGMVVLGLWAARRVGLEVPLLETWLDRQPPPRDAVRNAGCAAGLGAACGLAIVMLDTTLFAAVGESLRGVVPSPPRAWQGLLASVYGGVTEEVQLRLFLFSLLALGASWLRRRFRAQPGAELTPTIFWIVNAVVALVFGLAHLPVMAELVALTPLVVARSILLNGLVGLAAGFLYYRRGLEMAMLCHFSADVVLHVVVPLAGGPGA
ncbi:MAG: CPBP family intramembrane glutamic endopeptidase [Woeseiaceae bacterium]|nr:CPBP family intramembrane glutamic endopeptidase [Woeseiaceae bacterium]